MPGAPLVVPDFVCQIVGNAPLERRVGDVPTDEVGEAGWGIGGGMP
jgi:hypothetical protein